MQAPQTPGKAPDAVRLWWKVAPAPTGRYRAFQTRGWPSAFWDRSEQHCAAYIASTTGDDYTPAKGRGAAPCGQLCVFVADYSGEGWRWRKLAARADTLAAAKELAAAFLQKYPQFRPEQYR